MKCSRIRSVPADPSRRGKLLPEDRRSKTSYAA